MSNFLVWHKKHLNLKANQLYTYNLTTQSNIVQVFNKTASGGATVFLDETDKVSPTYFSVEIQQGKNASLVKPYELATVYLYAQSDVSIEIIEIQSQDLSFMFTASQVVDVQGSVQVQEPVTVDGVVEINNADGVAIESDVVQTVGLKASELNLDANGDIQTDVLSLPSLPAGTNNIGNVDVASLPSLPAGANNIGSVDVNTLPRVEKSDFTYQEVSAGASGEIQVKASAGRVVSLTSDGTANVQLRDGTGNNVWKAITGEVHFPEPIEHATDITLNFDASGTAYIIYR